ncbi:hypothetical protein BJ170DRAFT_501392 [Xylariales sp. AK1849]|nr:hypothetical protein BJ170DRAFT_501392 [Xylariales sp. AK1849]
MQLTTIFKLPNQPLPSIQDGGSVGPVFVTIWLVILTAFFFLFWWILRKSDGPTESEFYLIRIATLLLAISYLLSTLDGWFHYWRVSVSYGYVFLNPISEFFRVGSSVLFLSGTFKTVWLELEDRFTLKVQAYWWTSANIALFIVSLVSIFYVVLYLALAIVWIEFLSFNTIADVATKRTHFEITMAALSFAFGMLIVYAASATLFSKAKKINGRIPMTRVLTLWLPTIFLLLRSLMEFVLALLAYGPSVTRQDLSFIKDVYYGLLTCLYLSGMLGMAFKVTLSHDSGGRESRLVESAIRKYILDTLDKETEHRQKASPKFESFLNNMLYNLQTIIQEPLFSLDPVLDETAKQRYAVDYIEQLKKKFGHLDPKEISKQKHTSPSASRTATPFSGIFKRGMVKRASRNKISSTLTSDMRNSGSEQATGSLLFPQILEDDGIQRRRIVQPRSVPDFGVGIPYAQPISSASNPTIGRSYRHSSAPAGPTMLNHSLYGSPSPASVNQRFRSSGNMPSMDAVQEDGANARGVPHPTYRRGPRNVHYHSIGNPPSPTASPMPSDWASPAASPRTMFAQPATIWYDDGELPASPSNEQPPAGIYGTTQAQVPVPAQGPSYSEQDWWERTTPTSTVLPHMSM